jgi:hypothetical protein
MTTPKKLRDRSTPACRKLRDKLKQALDALAAHDEAMQELAFWSAGDGDPGDELDAIRAHIHALRAAIECVPAKAALTDAELDTLRHFSAFRADQTHPVTISAAAVYIAEKRGEDAEAVRQRLYRLPAGLLDDYNQPGGDVNAEEIFAHLAAEND